MRANLFFFFLLAGRLFSRSVKLLKKLKHVVEIRCQCYYLILHEKQCHGGAVSVQNICKLGTSTTLH